MTHADFKKRVRQHYRKHGRVFPWRTTRNPYRILVSEVMLQQTQTDRVVPKYKEFLKAFPTVQSLAQASLKKVLSVWQGLGYNRRALLLKAAAQTIVKEYKGKVPQDTKALISLPGIGSYTAAAIRVFAYNIPDIVIETNIRSVFIEHYADLRRTNADARRNKKIYDKELIPLIEKTLDHKNPREWYSALMDYGAYLKQTTPNPSRKSAHHTKQSPFKGSDRQLRGRILKYLLSHPAATSAVLAKKLNTPQKKLFPILTTLAKEKLITKKKQKYTIV